MVCQTFEIWTKCFPVYSDSVCDSILMTLLKPKDRVPLNFQWTENRLLINYVCTAKDVIEIELSIYFVCVYNDCIGLSNLMQLQIYILVQSNTDKYFVFIVCVLVADVFLTFMYLHIVTWNFHCVFIFYFSRLGLSPSSPILPIVNVNNRSTYLIIMSASITLYIYSWCDTWLLMGEWSHPIWLGW